MKYQILNYLGQKFGEQAVCTTCNVINSIWSLASMVAVPVLAAGAAFMLLEQPSITAIDKTNGGPTVVVAQTTPAYLSSPVHLSSDVRRAAFNTYIKDQHGNVVFKYPQFITETPGQNVSFKLPLLPEGTYYVRTKITYQLNPLKNAELDVGVARVVVENLGGADD